MWNERNQKWERTHAGPGSPHFITGQEDPAKGSDKRQEGFSYDWSENSAPNNREREKYKAGHQLKDLGTSLTDKDVAPGPEPHW